jgi:hypothetical protein
MTTLAQRLDQIVDSAVDRAFAELERCGSYQSPIDVMHDFLQRDSRFPKLGYLETQLTFYFLIKDDIEELRDHLADALRSELADEGLQVRLRSIDPGESFNDQVRDAVTYALNGLFPDGKITAAAEPLFWIAVGLIAYENGSRDAAHAVAWAKHQLGLDAPPPDPLPPPSSPPPRAASTVVPFNPKRRAKKGRKAVRAISV